ncbi:Oxygen-independent coproporphyrinogen-III oxidase 1 [Candidatus Fokinia cryptica]|uniref:Oxygen-independent coproporphyrinogen-III oxidase 1 n=1 Tax=Candidatus Fokinia crypta TaxID=1920990 RepID=A0ABZ0UN32_9RICK|nr:Oxygen-independent coproporphyrinogen-III oxidase 1 [Candidatus Fokinia cryptica]
MDFREWGDAYIKRLSFYKPLLQKNGVSTLFIGGGTPSLVPVSEIDCIVRFVSDFQKVPFEVTIEMNPRDITRQKLIELKNCGINRVSVGIQSVQPERLKFLGRDHSAEDAIRSMEEVSSIFSNYSFDLISGTYGQTTEGWRWELDTVMKYKPSHLSVYHLTIEPKTKFNSLKNRGLLREIDDEMALQLYEVTNELLESYGLRRYEISNYARKGYESVHNLSYWKYEEYIGIGPGAHGRIRAQSYQLLADSFEPFSCHSVALVDDYYYEQWFSKVKQNADCINTVEFLDEKAVFMEKLLTGLRLESGVKIDDIMMQNLKFSTVQSLCNDNMLWYDKETCFMGVPLDKFRLLNHIISSLIQ